MKKDLVKKSNSLNEAYYHLTLVEYRILHMAFSALAECEVKPEFFRQVRISIKASDYMELYDVDRATAYQALQEASERLFNRYFTYDDLVNKDLMLYERLKSRWVTKIGYIDSQATISLYLSDDVLSMVGKLDSRYTYYYLNQIANLTSMYAVRIYEMLMQWRKKKIVPSIGIEELRERLGIAENEYPRMDNFKSRVLDIAIQQINEHTDIIANYIQEKDGRNITGFTFKFKDKNKKKKAIDKVERDPDTIDWVNGATDKESQLLSPKQADYFASKLAEDSGFGSKFGGNGENMKVFISRLSNELQRDISKLAVYMPYLLKAGYNSQTKN